MNKVLCIGDAMIDVIVQMKSAINVNSDTLSEISMHGGGAAANTATWLAHVGVTTSFAGRIGADISGANFHAELNDFGVQHENPPLRGQNRNRRRLSRSKWKPNHVSRCWS